MAAARDVFMMKRRVFRDAETGREVWQITDGEFECVTPYMDKGKFTADDRYIVFMSNRTGSWQPYRLELATGFTAQLCEVRNAGCRSVVLDTVHGEAYCQDDYTFVAVHVETLERRVAVDYSRFFGAPEAVAKGAAAVLNRDGTLVVIGIKPAPPRMGTGFAVARTEGSNEFECVYIPREDIGGGHELFCPGDDNIISFHGYPDRQNNPAETSDHRVGQWRLERRSGRLAPLAAVPVGFRLTHSLWGASGDRFYFHRKTVPQWVPTALCSVDRNGGDLRVYYETDKHRLGHSATSPDEKWIVTDSQDPDRNILMLVSTVRNEQHMLCWPNTSIGSPRPDKRLPHLPPHLDRHTHPGFSPSGRLINYTSDVSGRSQVYVVPVADLVE